MARFASSSILDRYDNAVVFKPPRCCSVRYRKHLTSSNLMPSPTSNDSFFKHSSTEIRWRRSERSGRSGDEVVLVIVVIVLIFFLMLL